MVWALLVAVLLGTMTTSCERDNEVEALNNPYEANQSESEPTSPEEEDQFVKALSAIPGISDVRMDQVILDTRKGYYFKVEQLVDNSDVSKGTFKQLTATSDSHCPRMPTTSISRTSMHSRPLPTCTVW